MILLAPMKFMLLGIFTAFFVALLLYALDAVVMPELTGMAHFYSHECQTAQALASGQSTTAE